MVYDIHIQIHICRYTLLFLSGEGEITDLNIALRALAGNHQ